MLALRRRLSSCKIVLLELSHSRLRMNEGTSLPEILVRSMIKSERKARN